MLFLFGFLVLFLEVCPCPRDAEKHDNQEDEKGRYAQRSDQKYIGSR